MKTLHAASNVRARVSEKSFSGLFKFSNTARQQRCQRATALDCNVIFNPTSNALAENEHQIKLDSSTSADGTQAKMHAFCFLKQVG
jgi:hypothetical protein